MGRDGGYGKPRPDADVPGFAPRPKGQATPRPLSKSVRAGSLKPKWSPNAGWKPARLQNPGVRASIAGARSMTESVASEFKAGLRATGTGPNAMGPLAGGGGSGGKTGNKTK